MRKRIIAILSFLAVATTSVFAVTGYVGLGAGYNYSTTTIEVAEEMGGKTKLETQSFPILIKGATYFGEKDLKFGVAYGFSFVDFPMETKLSSVGVLHFQ